MLQGPENLNQPQEPLPLYDKFIPWLIGGPLEQGPLWQAPRGEHRGSKEGLSCRFFFWEISIILYSLRSNVPNRPSIF